MSDRTFLVAPIASIATPDPRTRAITEDDDPALGVPGASARFSTMWPRHPFVTFVLTQPDHQGRGAATALVGAAAAVSRMPASANSRSW